MGEVPHQADADRVLVPGLPGVGAVDLLPHLINVPGGPIGDDGYWGPSLSAGKGLAGGDTINFGIGGRF